MKLCSYFLLCVFTSVFVLSSFSRADEEEYQDNSLQRVVKALQSSVQYFNSTINRTDSLNLNFILAVALGQQQGLLDHLRDLNVSENENMKEINKQIEEIINQLQTMLKVSLDGTKTLEDSNEFKELFDPDLWRFYSPINKINESLVRPLTDDDDSFADDYSDDCLASLFGAGEYSKECTITTTCWTMTSDYNYNNYSLTHQLLYFIVAQRMNCWGKMEDISNEKKQPTPKQQIDIKCANIFNESKEIATKNFPLTEGDIFLQQSLFCGIAGYNDFFSSDWLEAILNWQRSSGCFSNSLEGDCSSHFTLLAVGAFGQYIRYIVDEKVMSLSATDSKDN